MIPIYVDLASKLHCPGTWSSAMWLIICPVKYRVLSSGQLPIPAPHPTPLVVIFPPSPNHGVPTVEYKRQFAPHWPFGDGDGALIGQGKVRDRAEAGIKAQLRKATYWCLRPPPSLWPPGGSPCLAMAPHFHSLWLDGPEEAATPLKESGWVTPSQIVRYRACLGGSERFNNLFKIM